MEQAFVLAGIVFVIAFLSLAVIAYWKGKAVKNKGCYGYRRDIE